MNTSEQVNSVVNNYKIESKQSIYHVVIYTGRYSDYIEKHFFFKANSPEESWLYLCDYIENENSIKKEEDGWCQFQGIRGDNNNFISKYKDREVDLNDDWSIWVLKSSKPLSVIYFEDFRITKNY